jgi:spore maturation protein SpmA
MPASATAAQEAPVAPPPRPGPPAPGWTTSEFWSMLLAHAIAVVTIVLTFTTGSSDGVQGAEAVVPAAALLLSAAAHVAYVRGRVRLKLGHLGRVAGQIEADVRAVEPLARQLAPLVMAEDPALAQRIAAAVTAGQGAEQAATPSSREAATPAG